ncbi:MAG: AAA family ATPase [Thermoproteota archaeon]|nr:ATP-binding protein [Candidatus Brockarchaeota archaeon]
MIIERPEEAKRINELKKWILVYGRRKTGKTFLVANFVNYDEYFFVKTSKSALTKDGKSISYEAFIEVLKRALDDGKTVVVDEFHRLGQDFLDFLHYTNKRGKLILISSTLFLSKKLVSTRSPILGLFAEVPIGLISLKDCLKALGKYGFSKKDRMELAIMLREPISIDYFDEKKPVRENIALILLSSVKTIPALVGEVFYEEERELSAIYEGVLRAVASGRSVSGEIASYLFSRRLIKKDDASIIQPYLNNLTSLGLVKRIEVLNKRKYVYKLTSPLLRMFFYADEKYNISERRLSNIEALRIVDELMPRIIEDSIREFFAEKYGLRESVLQAKDFDVDSCLLKFNKPEIVLEVKWGRINSTDVRKAEENLGKVPSKRKILFVPDKRLVKSSKLEVLDVDDVF